MDLRLRCIFDLVGEDKNIVDVGTDHGYLPIYLALYKKCKTITACDINQDPLEKAKKNISRYNLSDKINLVLSDGLKNIKNEQADEIIIAGIGGELIAEIIEACPYIREKILILQPMTKIEYLREYLYDSNFEIIKEIPILYNDKFYSIILAKISEKILYEKDEVYINLGKTIYCKNEFRKSYIKYKYNNIKTIIKDLKKSNSTSSRKKTIYLKKVISEISRYL